MFAVDNPTPLAAALVPGVDAEGRTEATVVVKATFRLREGDPALADEQVPILRADEHHGEPGLSSVRHEADLSPQKPSTDVILVGHAWAHAPVAELDVVLSAGPLRKTVRVFGDRGFYRAGSKVGISAPRPFTRMPLVYERAFGGPSADENPVGVGLAEDAEAIDGQRLPNLEDPRALVAHPGDRPSPMGFGVVARHWMPRRALAGTCDDAWRAERFPLPARDFDRRFFQAAPADLVAPRPFQGGEPVRLEGAAEGGPIAFRVPRLDLSVSVSIRGSAARHAPVLDTVVIEPDERRAVLVYRLTFPCPRNYLPIDGVGIDLRGAS